MNKYVYFDSDKKGFNTLKECVDIIIEEYHSYDVSMWDILSGAYIVGVNAEDIVNIYAECMKRSDGDIIIRVSEDIESEYNDEEQDVIDKLIQNNTVLGLDK